MHVIGDISGAINRIESLSFCALRRFHYVVRLLFATWNSYWRPTSFEEQITIGEESSSSGNHEQEHSDCESCGQPVDASGKLLLIAVSAVLLFDNGTADNNDDDAQVQMIMQEQSQKSSHVFARDIIAMFIQTASYLRPLKNTGSYLPAQQISNPLHYCIKGRRCVPSTFKQLTDGQAADTR